MTQPRSILSGSTYLLTRRVVRRHLLLRPDETTTNIILYTLAVHAQLYGIQVHALCTMSSHIHLVVTDVLGVLPDFLRDFHRIISLAATRHLDWEGPLWDSEHTNVVELTTRQAIVEKIAYTLANPVTANLVHRADEWPGAKIRLGEMGRGVLRATRPRVYFSPRNPHWPAEATVDISLPPMIAPEDADDFRSDVAVELERLEAAAHEHAKSTGATVLGAAGARKISIHDRAKSAELQCARNPTFAVGHGAKKLRQQVSAAVRAFRESYRAALDEWLGGAREVFFPPGTWWMRVFHGVFVV